MVFWKPQHCLTITQPQEIDSIFDFRPQFRYTNSDLSKLNILLTQTVLKQKWQHKNEVPKIAGLRIVKGSWKTFIS